MKPAWIGLAALACSAACMAAAPVVTLVDETRSSIRVRLCIEGNCDSDTSRVDGSVEISADHYRDPRGIALHDFEFILLDDLVMSIDIFLGGLDVQGVDIVARYATPGTPTPRVPLNGGDFRFVDVPMDLEGLFLYDAWGTMCAILTAAGRPCNDTIDLGSMGTQTADEMTGNLAIAGDDITLTLRPDVTVPLDPTQPDLGQASMSGTVIAVGTVPACAATPARVDMLMAARRGAALDLSWREGPSATSGYRAYSVDETAALPAEWANALATVECETSAPAATSCSDPDAMSVPAPLLLYQVVGVCDDGTEGPN